jgi:predicted MFS family arabinose efflux permease
MIAFLILGGVAIAIPLLLARLFVPSRKIAGFDRGVDNAFKLFLRACVLFIVGIIVLSYLGVIK